MDTNKDRFTDLVKKPVDFVQKIGNVVYSKALINEALCSSFKIVLLPFFVDSSGIGESIEAPSVHITTSKEVVPKTSK